LRKFVVPALILGAVSLLMLLPAMTQAQVRADKILVLKSKRQLLLMSGRSVLKTYRISLGRNPDGAKTHRGDGRTPEGHYTINSRNQYSRFHLALHVSYPNSTDLARAGGMDPGGNIMIHGLPNGHGPRWQEKQFTDWTAGCIAVSDQVIEQIWRLVPDGTPIEIRA
jgi:murein L,D-transpeptidase YafK